MPDQPFVNLIDNQPPDWRSRVKGCIVHTANAVFIKAAPTVAQGPSDALGRAVVLDPDLWTILRRERGLGEVSAAADAGRVNTRRGLPTCWLV
jgi:hypothetical protein